MVCFTDKAIQISTMGSNGGMTCYKSACDSGYYLDTPSTSYFKRKSSTGALGLTCWQTTGCASGYSENATGTAHSYKDRTCKQCIYTCPSGSQASTCGSNYYQTGTTSMYCIGDPDQTKGICYKCTACSWVCPDDTYYDGSEGSSYYTTGKGTKEVCSGDKSKTRPGGSNVCYSRKSCSWVCEDNYYTSASGDYKLTSTSTAKVCDGDKTKKHSSAKCYTRTLKGCTDYNSSYKTSVPSGQTCDEVEPRDGLICYKDCKATCLDGYYTTKPGSAFKYDTDTSTSLTCYKVTGYSSGYHSYNWTDIKDAYVKKTYTYDPQNYNCYTYTCASGYTALKSGYTCKSGIECSYNGGNCCCPNGNLEKDEEDNDGYFTVIAKIDSSCVSDSVSLALTDGKGTYYSSGTSTSGMTVTTANSSIWECIWGDFIGKTFANMLMFCPLI